MKKRGTIVQAMCAVAIVAAIAFGAREAFAASAMEECIYDPPTQVGECASQNECYELCLPYDPIQTDCFKGCCYCAVR